MRKKRFSESGSLAIRNHRRLAPLSEGSLLSPFRQLTHTRQTRVFLPKTARVSSQSGARFFSMIPKIHQDLRFLDARGVDRIRQTLPTLTREQMQKICRDRKSRREVIFAIGASGGNHRPPTYNFKSLVRC